jgi:hypothetical protein
MTAPAQTAAAGPSTPDIQPWYLRYRGTITIPCIVALVVCGIWIFAEGAKPGWHVPETPDRSEAILLELLQTAQADAGPAASTDTLRATLTGTARIGSCIGYRLRVEPRTPTPDWELDVSALLSHLPLRRVVVGLGEQRPAERILPLAGARYRVRDSGPVALVAIVPRQQPWDGVGDAASIEQRPLPPR